jgi:thiol-disulfide isomerase/thioredoxin
LQNDQRKDVSHREGDLMSVDAKFAGVLAPLAVAAAILCIASAAGPARAAPEIGTPAPALVITELDGNMFDLTKLRGKVVLVNYWATWCAPCRKDMPKLDAFIADIMIRIWK